MIPAAELLARAACHRDAACVRLHRTHKQARKLLKKHALTVHRVRTHSVRALTLGTVTASFLLAPVLGVRPQHVRAAGPSFPATTVPAALGPDAGLRSRAAPFSEAVRSFDRAATRVQGAEERELAGLIGSSFGINASSSLDGISLNAQRGIMAGEQHLPLYPGDTLASHASDPTARLTGMVPGLPAWGYFAPSAKAVTSQDVQNERWYVAAQTFLSPQWDGTRTEQLYRWFKYRKVIAVNPSAGTAVVCDIADSGPGPSTKRTFGGSNEVLIGLGLGSARTGRVIMLFIDDPEGRVPLGPLTGYAP